MAWWAARRAHACAYPPAARPMIRTAPGSEVGHLRNLALRRRSVARSELPEHAC